MKIKLFTLSLIILSSFQIYGQLILNADGPGNTYELINSLLAPDNEAVEIPDCSHPVFGRHIAEVWDSLLNQYVFEFYIHVIPDDDRCIIFDRQRNEIKTYEPSPDSLKGVLGETVTYKWKFKLPVGFQPSYSFTHVHQIKAVYGDDGIPIFTLTPRKGSPNKMELIHNNSTDLAVVDLSLFEGEWVECTEVVKIGANGTYSMLIKKISDSSTIISYSNNNIMTIRPDNQFIRPKWGIYRSLNNSADLRDEVMRFNSFSIQEAPLSLIPIAPSQLTAELISDNQINLNWVDNSNNENSFSIEKSNNNTDWNVLDSVAASITHYSDTSIGGNLSHYYRIRAQNSSGYSEYTNVASIVIGEVTSISSGNWSSPATWTNGVIPSADANVVIQSGNDVILDLVGAATKDLTVNGSLEFSRNDIATELTVHGNFSVGSTGEVKCSPRIVPGASNSFIAHSLSVYGDFNVEQSGVFDARGGSNSGGTANVCELTFTGPLNSNIFLSQSSYNTSVEEFNSITIDKTNNAIVILASGNLFMSNNTTCAPTTLLFNNGMIETGSNIWVQCRTSSLGVIGASLTSYINGSLGRGMSTLAGTTRDFEVGTLTGYRPITINSTTALASRSVVVVKIIESDANNNSNLSGGIDKVSALRYYKINAVVGDGGLIPAIVNISKVGPSYIDNDGVEPGNTDLRVAYSIDDRANWIGIPQTVPHLTTPSANFTQIAPDDFDVALNNSSTSLYTVLANATGGSNTLPVEDHKEKPEKFELQQNYPNPFNPSTSISYQLPATGNVSLKVYDILGNEIAILVNEEKPAGFYSVQFPTNNFQLGSGVYFYKLQAGDFIEIMKMVLIK
jgi:hypothetical protein